MWPLKLKFRLGVNQELNYKIDKDVNDVVTYKVQEAVFEISNSREIPLLDAIRDIVIDVSDKSKDGITEENFNFLVNSIYSGFGIGSNNNCTVEVGAGLISALKPDLIKFSYKRNIKDV